MNSNDDFVLSQAKIAIIGLGLMGGSLALALKGKCSALYGVDPDEGTRTLAMSQDIVDQAEEYLTDILPLVDLIILAAPVPSILDILESLPDITPKSCVVMDLGSTKVEIVKKMAGLPPCYEPIGGHPICGKEKLSLENAERTLYFAAPFLLTPFERTTSRANEAADQLIKAVGAKKEVLSPESHDRILANTSHLPFLISSALALATPSDVAPFVGPGFRSVSRLAGTPSSMMLGVILSNRENLLAALERLQDELAVFISAISENDSETLNASLMAAQNAYAALNGIKL